MSDINLKIPTDPVRVTEEASTFTESDVTVTNNNTTVSNGSIEFDGTQTSGDAIVAFDSGSPADIESWDLATFKRTLDGETVTVDVGETVFVDDVGDDFEDGDITANYGWNWSGDTGNLSAQQTTVLSGDWSGEINSPSSTNTELNLNRDTTAKPAEVSLLINFENTPERYNSGVYIYGSGGIIGGVKFEQDTDQMSTSAGSTIGSWSVGVTYNVTFRNIDYSNETYGVEVTDFSDGSTIGSVTNQSFSRSENNFDHIEVFLNNSDGSQQMTAYIDELLLPDFEDQFSPIYSNIGANSDISTIDPSKNVKLRASLSRSNTANNPTLDYAARRFTR